MTPKDRVRIPGAMPLDVLETLARAWVFTSTRPYSTVDVISEAKRRGVMLDAALLRELYRRRFMTPLAEVVSRRVTEPRDVTLQPRPTGTRQSQVQSALQHGRIRDLTTSPFRPRTRFDRGRIGDPRGWWNGLVYSRWQLLALADIRPYLERQRRTGTYERPIVRVPPPGDFLPIYQEWTHAALILTALEARYLPLARPRWIRITNADIEEWEQYRDSFDPKLAIDAFGITSSEVRARAEGMLSRAKVLDPLGTWSLLVRRALPKAWETLSGDALMAHELRLAAEILLLFYEDLASAGVADPLPTIDHHWHHPLLDRISDRSDGPLDRLLAAKGISPHPGVVLIVEGETEFRMVGRIRDHLGLGRDPDTLQVVCMRSADRQLPLLAAATAAPILGERRGDAFDMIRPPTRLVIAIDPDDLWDTDRKIAKQKRLIVEEIAKVTRAQGAIIDADELDRFVEVYTWDERCFEFEHFGDDELADGLREISLDASNMERSDLVRELGEARRLGRDIKTIWHTWNREPSKLELADALWPSMAAAIDASKRGEIDAPPLVAIVSGAHDLALSSEIGTFIINGVTVAPSTATP